MCSSHINMGNAWYTHKCFHPDRTDSKPSETTCPRLKSMAELERVDDNIYKIIIVEDMSIRAEIDGPVYRVKNSADGEGGDDD